jgi:prominin 1
VISLLSAFTGYIIVEERKVSPGPKVKEHDYADLVKKYWAIILVAFVVLITALLMPLIGLCFCCCRCINGRSQPFDKKHDTCRRFFLGLFLFIVWSAMM